MLILLHLFLMSKCRLYLRVHFLPCHPYHQVGLEDLAVQEVQYHPGDPVKIS